MPNWCSNTATISHKDPDQIIRVAEAFKQGRLFSEFVPVPEDLNQTTAGYHGDPDSQANLELKQKVNLEMHGYANWYDFCHDRWGTKWDAGGSDQPDPEISDDGLSVYLSFDTAWSPPINWYYAMMDGGFSISAEYYEPGMMFVGRFIDGHDECFNIPNSVEEISNLIPRDLDDNWAITENMQQYQDED